MLEQEKLQEIENIGNEEENQENISLNQNIFGGLPLFQAAICVLLLLALVVLKFSDISVYNKVTDWYQNEMSREIELPQFGKDDKKGTSSLSGAEPFDVTSLQAI